MGFFKVTGLALVETTVGAEDEYEAAAKVMEDLNEHPVELVEMHDITDVVELDQENEQPHTQAPEKEEEDE